MFAIRPVRVLLLVALLALLSGTALAAPLSQAQAITLQSPAPGMTVGSPVVITGFTNRYPANGLLSYQFSTAAGAPLGGGQFEVFQGDGGTGLINTSLVFSPPPRGGAIRLEVLDRNPDGSVLANAWLDLRVAAPSANEESIVIETPTPGTIVGSPVTVTGRINRLPNEGTLAYDILGEGTTNLGSGVFPVSGQPGEPARFTASLAFNLPPQGGAVRILISDREPGTGAYIAYSAVDVQVAPPPAPAAISIDSPTSGATVSSSVLVSGSITRIPERGFLTIRMVDANEQEIGNGAVMVSPRGNGGGTFRVSYTFNAPPQGGPARIDVFDRAFDGTITTQSSVAVQVASSLPPPTAPPPPPPPPVQGQVISFDSPPPGAQVGSPVTIVGRTSRYPSLGLLYYRFFSGAGALLGQGTFGVAAAQDGSSTFQVSLTFSLPAGGGPVRLEVREQDRVGNVLGVATLDLQVAAAEELQQIFIDAPPSEAPVTSPVTITGRTTRFPVSGALTYRFTDPNGGVLGQGTFPVGGGPSQPGAFTATLGYNSPPGGGFFRLELYDINPNGQTAANAFLTLRTADSTDGGQLLNRRWRLDHFDDEGQYDGVRYENLTISFSTNGYARLFGGCNSPTANYRVDGDSISFDGFDRGSRDCGAGINEQETRYFDALESATAWRLDGDTLVLTYNGGRSFLYFVPF